MKLYHGSNTAITRIDLTRCKPYKDFGQGFYLTEINEAIALFYNSETFTKLSDPATGLYAESSAYVYEILKTELKMGKIQ